MQICVLAPEWNLHTVLSTVQQGAEDKEGRGNVSAERWKTASDEDSLMFPGLF